MREVLETFSEELRRRMDSGETDVFIDDESLAILRKMGARLSAVAPGETVGEVEFASADDAVPAAAQAAPAKKRLRVAAAAPRPQEGAQAAIPQPEPFELPAGSKQERWEFLRGKVFADPVCNAHLHAGKKLVVGVGNLDADIFFCGEAPGADEETQGLPFVGKAGQLLTKIITAMGLKREDVYIGNIMNWRPECPKGNRPPTPEEMNYCLPYLRAQIEIVKPRVVVALGKTAVSGLLGDDPKRTMAKARGTWHSYGGADLMITYHPSFLLQYASTQMKRLVWEDMLAVMRRVGMPISEKQLGYFLPK